VPGYALERVQDESNPLSEELVTVPQLSLSMIGMNVEMPPFDDPKVRQAFSLMIDQQLISEVTLNDNTNEARGIMPPGIPGYNPDLPRLDANLEQARALLAESSYGSAEALPPIVAYGGGWTGLLAEVAEEEFGIEIEIRTYENFGDYFTALDENAFLLFSYSWIADYPDPENFVDVLFRGGSAENHMNYDNPEVNALLDQAATETDDEQRWELYRQAEQQILQDAPFIPISHGVNHTLIKPYVRGLEVTPMGILDLAAVELVRQ
jgi:ABC-type transport system substrate-binding protein